ADASHLARDLFRSCCAASRRIHVQDDGFDGIVIGEFLQPLDGLLSINDDAFQVHDANFVAMATVFGILLAGADAEVNQRKDREEEEKESATRYQSPQPGA